jgi:hypothetical protein
MEFSIYSSGFNLLKNNFDYEGAIENFCSFADEVVIAVNTSSDGTLETLQNLAVDYGNLKIVACDFSYDDPLLDGKIKNFALQKTTKEWKIGLDLDERVPLRHKSLWKMLAKRLDSSGLDAWMIPSLNLWGDLFSIKNNVEDNLGAKWYLHRGGLERGPVNFARNPDGTVNTERSDTCELINSTGNLARSASLLGNSIPTKSIEDFLFFLENQATFVYHLGYSSYEDRVTRNKNFWKKHWETESGGKAPKHKVHMDVSEFGEETVKHNLKFWDE